MLQILTVYAVEIDLCIRFLAVTSYFAKYRQILSCVQIELSSPPSYQWMSLANQRPCTGMPP